MRFVRSFFVLFAFLIFLTVTPKAEAANDLQIRCAAYDLSRAMPQGTGVIGDTIRWSYIYQSGTAWSSGNATWSGTDGLNVSIPFVTNFDTTISYSTPGVKNATLNVTTNLGQNATANCSINILASVPPPPPALPGGVPPSGVSVTNDEICGIGSNAPVQEFVGKLYGCGLGFIGGVALIAILVGGYIILTSQGDPGRVRTGREYITYAVIGVVLAVTGYAVYRIIAGDLLKIPGFS